MAEGVKEQTKQGDESDFMQEAMPEDEMVAMGLPTSFCTKDDVKTPKKRR